MASVKETSEFPHMAAAKFLHFYNPRLFPIYDKAIIWNQILDGTHVFEWHRVCGRYGIKVKEGSERFLITYFLWAAEIMGSADEGFMAEFERAFRHAAGPAANGLADLNQYYAAAFEYGLLGCSRITRGNQ